MADDRNNAGARDRSTVSAEESYEVSHFAQKHGIPAEEARKLIERVGNNREKLDAAAEQMKR